MFALWHHLDLPFLPSPRSPHENRRTDTARVRAVSLNQVLRRRILAHGPGVLPRLREACAGAPTAVAALEYFPFHFQTEKEP